MASQINPKPASKSEDRQQRRKDQRQYRKHERGHPARVAEAEDGNHKTTHSRSIKTNAVIMPALKKIPEETRSSLIKKAPTGGRNPLHNESSRRGIRRRLVQSQFCLSMKDSQDRPSPQGFEE